MEMGLSEVYMIIRDIQNCSSTKAKQHIVKSNANNETFKKILMYAYNDMQYGVKKTTISKMEFNPDEDYLWNNIWSMFEDLAKSNINNDLVLKISNTIGYFTNENVRELLIRVLLKDLRIGMNVKSINKAIPNLIHQHQVQLASKFEGVLKEEVSMSLKEDGIRCTILIDEDNNVKMISRQGKAIEYVNKVEKAIKNMNLQGYMLDGELLRINSDNIPSDDNFRLSTKIINSKSTNKIGLEYIVFDMVPLEDYNKNESNIPYRDRLKLMEEKIVEGEFVNLVPKFGTTKDPNVVYEMLNKVVSEGYEGLCLNVLSSPYQFKRTKNLLKVKKFNDCDLLVVDIEEGEGRLEGTLGKIKCQFKYEGKIYTTFVGSGFNDFERKYLYENPNEVIGKVITASYFEKSKNEKGEINLRFCTWKGMEYIRTDKNGIDDTNVD